MAPRCRPLLVLAALVGTLAFAGGAAYAASPAEDSVSPTKPKTTWTGPASGATGPTDPASCKAQGQVGCDVYSLLVSNGETAPEESSLTVTSTVDNGLSAAADIDLYVYDPQGKLAKQSASSGGAEAVTITKPDSGKWTVVVTSFATVGTYTGTTELKQSAPNPPGLGPPMTSPVNQPGADPQPDQSSPRTGRTGQQTAPTTPLATSTGTRTKLNVATRVLITNARTINRAKRLPVRLRVTGGTLRRLRVRLVAPAAPTRVLAQATLPKVSGQRTVKLAIRHPLAARAYTLVVTGIDAAQRRVSARVPVRLR